MPTPPPTPNPVPHQISRIARTAVYNRLVDPLLGFNPLIEYQNFRYGLDPPINDIDISVGSRNFIFGQLNASTLIGTTSFKFPLIALYTHGIQNRNFIKFREFSGMVTLGVDVWHSWTKVSALHDFETYADAFEEVVVEIVNGFGPSGNGDVTQNWGTNLVYNGGVSCSRTMLETDGDNWTQGYQFRFLFHLDTSLP